MALVEESKTGGVRLAVEGCVSQPHQISNLRKRNLTFAFSQGHGTLHDIYTAVEGRCKSQGWDGVDMLIIGGDFQVSCPVLYIILLAKRKTRP